MNDIFRFFEEQVTAFVSSVFFSGLVFYILLTVIKGNIKFGIRFLFVVPIHPMKIGRTFINSFLINIFVLMLCAPAVLHFTIHIFHSYMNMTSA